MPVEQQPMPEQQQQMPEQQNPQQQAAAGGWVRLEEVISYLQNVDKNRQGHDIEIVAKSNTGGIHKFEITVKEKPMLQKAQQGMAAAASSKPKVEIRVAMTADDQKKLLRQEYPSKFLKSMGLI